MVVEIRGSIDSETAGTASSVVAEDVIKGMMGITVTPDGAAEYRDENVQTLGLEY